MDAYVAIGANMGRKRFTLTRATRAIAALEGVRLHRVSPLYRTQAVGGPVQPAYLNGVLHLKTHLSPRRIMMALLSLERAMGRVRRIKWGPRVLDLDLLAVGKTTCRRTGLVLPHPRYHLRRFVLVPFCDVAPRFVHPRFGIRNHALLRKLTLPGQRVTMAALWNGTRFSPSKPKRRPKSPSSR